MLENRLLLNGTYTQKSNFTHSQIHKFKSNNDNKWNKQK